MGFATGILSTLFSQLLEMDHVATRVEGGKAIYTFKTTSLAPSLTEIKSKIFSVLDFPVDIPEDVTVREVKRGPIYKEYLVDIVVNRESMGKLSNLLARKYPSILGRRGYLTSTTPP